MSGHYAEDLNGYDPDAKYGECTIDRINVYGNYEPDNCRWVTLYEQSQNKRKKVVWGVMK